MVSQTQVSKAVANVVQLTTIEGAYRATRFLSPSLVVKSTAPHKHRKNTRSRTVVVTVGKPNYRERGMIKLFQSAKEPFPVKQIQIRWGFPN